MEVQMKNKFLQNLIKQGENVQFEIKASFRSNSISSVICSFLNTNGGTLLIGANDNGDIIGLPNPDKYKTEIEHLLFTTIIPEPAFDVSIEEIQNKKVLLIKVWKGSKPPYIFNGSIYYRKNAISRKATSAEVSKLIENRNKSELHWEKQITFNLKFDDLDKELISNTIDDMKRHNRGNLKSSDIMDFLTHYGLYVNGAFTNACCILFCKYPERFIPQIRVRLTEYPESKTSNILNRDEIIEGNIFLIRNHLEKYFNNLGIRSVFDENQWKRIDFKFPPKALQEAIINALIHRNYSNYSSSFAVSIYPDKIEISNSGHLPEGLKISDLKKTHSTHPVNPDIAHIVFLRGLIDKLGRGTNKIVELCKNNGLKEPKWIQNSSGISITIFGPKALSKKIKAKILSIESVSDIVNDAVNDAVNDRIKLRYMTEIQMIVDNNSIDISSIMEELNISRAQAQRDMKTLKIIGFVIFEGAPKTGAYYLTNKLKKILT